MNGDMCSACGHPFIRNYIGFDTLPLVEFVPQSNIPFEKARSLLKLDPPEQEGSGGDMKKETGGDGWKENIYGEE